MRASTLPAREPSELDCRLADAYHAAKHRPLPARREGDAPRIALAVAIRVLRGELAEIAGAG